MLIFEDPNLLRNGGFNEDKNEDGSPDHWQLVKSAEDVEANLAYDEAEQAGRMRRAGRKTASAGHRGMAGRAEERR